jgi:hypothetical protein
MMQNELIALYKRIAEELDNNAKFYQRIKDNNNQWDEEKRQEISIENKVLLRERNDLGEILWHSGIDTKKLSVANESTKKEQL